MWESTPDGRDGWRPLAAAGWPVHVVDGVDAGRAGRAPDSWREGHVEWKAAAQLWSRYRIGTREGWPARRGLPGQRFPVEHLDVLLATHVPHRRTTDAAETAALVEAVASVGRCHLVAHSHGAALVAGALDAIADNVDRVVLIEPLPLTPALSQALPARVLLVWGDHMTGHELWAPRSRRITSAVPRACACRRRGSRATRMCQ